MVFNSKKIIKGTYFPPGDKSISHRSLILTGQTVGRSEVSNLLEGEDVLNTQYVMRQLGARILKKKRKIHNIWNSPWSFISTKQAFRFW